MDETSTVQLSDRSQPQSLSANATTSTQHKARTTSLRNSINSWILTAHFESHIASFACRISQGWAWVQSRRAAILLAVGTFVGVLVAIIALKPTFEGHDASERALALAEWTALKDFLSYCWDTDDSRELSADCASVIDEPLPPPPHFDRAGHMKRLVKRMDQSAVEKLGLRSRKLTYKTDLETIAILTAAYLSILAIWVLSMERYSRTSRVEDNLRSKEDPAWRQITPWSITAERPEHPGPPPRGGIPSTTHEPLRSSMSIDDPMSVRHRNISSDSRAFTPPVFELEDNEVKQGRQPKTQISPSSVFTDLDAGIWQTDLPQGLHRAIKREFAPRTSLSIPVQTYTTQYQGPTTNAILSRLGRETDDRKR